MSNISFVKIIAISLLATLLLVSCKDTLPNGKATTGKAASGNPEYYTEAHRPQYHFSPAEKWMNDPNGMVYFEGEYHLFYQFYPDSNVWGPMHWGHAVSEDLVHWEHLPIALYPDSLGMIFSGSAVVDWKNTSGFGTEGQPPLIAIFTYHNMAGEKAGKIDYQSQGIAYSNDKGRTWTKYANNPVIPNPGIKDFRDPKVIWNESSNQWVMVFAAQNKVKFYGSPDLKSWTHLSDFGSDKGNHGGVWECPDLFPIQVRGTDDQKWVLLLSINPGGPNGGSATQYFVGDFDGKSFTLDPGFSKDVQNENAIWLDHGRDNYAGVTWSDIPKEDGRRLFMGWMSNWDYAQVVPTTAWRSAMTLPRTLELNRTAQGLRLFSNPVKETQSLRARHFTLEQTTLSGENKIDLTQELGFQPGLSEVILEFDWTAEFPITFGIELSNQKGERYRVGFDTEGFQYISDRTQAGAPAFSDKFASRIHTAPRLQKGNKVILHVFFDHSSAELFADGGSNVMTDIFFPSENFDRISVFTTEGGEIKVQGDVYEMKRIWGNGI